MSKDTGFLAEREPLKHSPEAVWMKITHSTV